MNEAPQPHDIVALLEDIVTTHFTAGTLLTVRRGQIGTVVLDYRGSAVEVEFCAAQGRAFALLAVGTDKLMVLHDTATGVAA